MVGGGEGWGCSENPPSRLAGLACSSLEVAVLAASNIMTAAAAASDKTIDSVNIRANNCCDSAGPRTLGLWQSVLLTSKLLLLLLLSLVGWISN